MTLSRLLAILATAFTVRIVPFDIVNADSIDDAVSEWMVENKVRGASVTFYDGSDPNNVISVSRGYGKVASSPTSADVTADTPFTIASVSKVFAAATVAVLLDLGIIASIDDDICDVLPSDWRRSACRSPHFPSVKVTWRMLMIHRSSLVGDIPEALSPETDEYVLAQYAPPGLDLDGIDTYGNPTCPLTSVREFYRAILTNDPNATTTVGGGDINWFRTMRRSTINRQGSWRKNSQPGSGYAYSNYAYGYIAALVELATNQSFESFSQERIFQPLLMSNTSWFRENLQHIPEEQQAMPVLYKRMQRKFIDIGHNCYIDYTSGQLYTSARDIGKFLFAMLTKGVPILWSDRVGDVVLSCLDGKGICSRNTPFRTGFGWALVNNSSKSSYFPDDDDVMNTYDWTGAGNHFGGTYGCSTFMTVLPASNVYMAVLANVEDAEVEALGSVFVNAVKEQNKR